MQDKPNPSEGRSPISVSSNSFTLNYLIDAATMNRIKKVEGLMADIERTAAGFQTVLPGCERRTLPKSTTRSDDAGQGLLEFYRAPTLRETLAIRTNAPLQPKQLRSQKKR
jgi:hypothetical protein